MAATDQLARRGRLLLALTVTASVFSAQYVLFTGPPSVAGWLLYWAGMLFRAYLWALFLPALAWLARVWPLSQRAWSRPLLRALLLSSLVSAGYAAALTTLTSLPVLEPIARGHALMRRSLASAPASFGSVLSFELPLALLTGWGLLCIAWALGRQRELQASAERVRRIEGSLRAARLQALEAQLHPHFLFNTLNCITALIDRDHDAAALTARRLSDLFALVLDHRRPSLVPLAEELALTRSYLEIQRTRFGAGLRVRYQIEPGCHDALVPVLLLQPLTENAVRHGVSGRAALGLIEVHARRSGERLVLEVIDDGPGFAPGAAFGTGLHNVERRVHELYGEGGSLTVSEGPGARISVSLPHRLGPGPLPGVGDLEADSVPTAATGCGRPELVGAGVAAVGMIALSALWATCAHFGYDAGRSAGLGLPPRILNAITTGAISWTLLGLVIFPIVRRLPFRPEQATRILLAHLLIAVLVFSPLKTLGLPFTVTATWTTSQDTSPALVWRVPWQISSWPGPAVLLGYWRMRVHEHVFYYLALAGLSYALIYFRSDQSQTGTFLRMRAELTERTLSSLRRRVYGHFVGRTLVDLPSLIERAPARAEQLISALADLLRHTLRADRHTPIALADEMASAALCAEVESCRTGEACAVHTTCSGELGARTVPPGMIEPLLPALFEEVRLHGRPPWRLEIAASVDPDGGHVAIDLRLAGQPGDRRPATAHTRVALGPPVSAAVVR